MTIVYMILLTKEFWSGSHNDCSALLVISTSDITELQVKFQQLYDCNHSSIFYHLSYVGLQGDWTISLSYWEKAGHILDNSEKPHRNRENVKTLRRKALNWKPNPVLTTVSLYCLKILALFYNKEKLMGMFNVLLSYLKPDFKKKSEWMKISSYYNTECLDCTYNKPNFNCIAQNYIKIHLNLFAVFIKGKKKHSHSWHPTPRCSAVRPWLSATLTLASLSSNNATTSMWPPATASISGVLQIIIWQSRSERTTEQAELEKENHVYLLSLRVNSVY